MRIAPILLLSSLACLPAVAQDAMLVPTPRATPISTSPTNRPFLAAGHAAQPVNLATAGFVEEEYTVSGLAGIYDWGATPTDPAKAVTQGVPYTTRLLLRRPKDAKKFSGRVIVELLDAASPYETAPLWGLSHGYFMARGDAWVGLTVAPAAVASLQRFDPVRYAALMLAATPPAGCTSAAGNGAVQYDLAWDIIAQTGALLRSSSKENPLLQFEPHQIIAAGEAAAGSAIVTYSNALHGLMRLGGGAPVYDGYVDVGATAGGAALSPCAKLEEADPRHTVMPRDVPFVTVMPQSQSAVADEADTDYRVYSIAGVPDLVLPGAGQPAAADLAIAGLEAVAESGCAGEYAAAVWGLALDAIWQQLQDRLTAGVPMSREPPTGRDAAGDVTGGWRLPPVDLSLAEGCPADSAQRYDAAKLRQLYGSRGEYLRRFQAAVDAAVQARRLTGEDGAALKASIAKSVPAF